VGHLAAQEQYLWLFLAQRKVLYPHLYEIVGFGQPASTPPLVEMWSAWRDITSAADAYLDTLTPILLQTYFIGEDGKPEHESAGTLLQRNLYHYWFHTGEAHAVRAMLGHTHLPEYVGNMEKAVYRPEKT
jgi:hypothetical protein